MSPNSSLRHPLLTFLRGEKWGLENVSVFFQIIRSHSQHTLELGFVWQSYCPPECYCGDSRRQENKEGLLLVSPGTRRTSRKFKGGAGLGSQDKEFICRCQYWPVFVATVSEAKSHLSLSDFELVLELRMTLNSWSFCLPFHRLQVCTAICNSCLCCIGDGTQDFLCSRRACLPLNPIPSLMANVFHTCT